MTHFPSTDFASSSPETLQHVATSNMLQRAFCAILLLPLHISTEFHEWHFLFVIAFAQKPFLIFCTFYQNKIFCQISTTWHGTCYYINTARKILPPGQRQREQRLPAGSLRGAPLLLSAVEITKERTINRELYSFL